jgi:RNA recognition motif-containing protein
MDKSKKEPRNMRGTRGARGGIQGASVTRERQEEKESPPKPSQQPRGMPKQDSSESNNDTKKVTRGSRVSRRGGQSRLTQRRNRRMRQPPRSTKRLERAQFAARDQPRGQRGAFRGRRTFSGMRRRPFGRRSIFISGLPKNVNRYRLTGLLRNEGRVLRCTLLRDRFGNSRGIAFAEMLNPRDAGKIIQKWRGRNVGGNTIYVAFKRNPRYRFNYPRSNNRFRNNRQFNNYGGYHPRYQRQIRPRGNRGRGRRF